MSGSSGQGPGGTRKAAIRCWRCAVRSIMGPLIRSLGGLNTSKQFRKNHLMLPFPGAQGLIESSAADHRDWRQQTAAQEQAAIAALLGRDDASRLRLEIAMDGVKAHIDGRWQEPKVATVLVRRLPECPKVPTRGAVLARRYVCVLGSADELITRIKHTIREAGWEPLP